MNERDSEQVAHSLIERGYEPAPNELEADVVLLNTCSVRDMADQKALGKMEMLGRLAKERPEMIFGFLGCMAQTRGETLRAACPTSILSSARKNSIALPIMSTNWSHAKADGCESSDRRSTLLDRRC